MSVEEALVGIYLAGGYVHRIEDVTQPLWGTKVSPSLRTVGTMLYVISLPNYSIIRTQKMLTKLNALLS